MMENQPIHWVSIIFRNRLYGNSFHKIFPTLKAIFELTKALLVSKYSRSQLIHSNSFTKVLLFNINPSYRNIY